MVAEIAKALNIKKSHVSYYVRKAKYQMEKTDTDMG